MIVEKTGKIYGNFEFDKVWELTSTLHAGQRYGGYQEGEFLNFIDHIEKVTFEVMTTTMFEHHLNANLAVKCAMLHDTLEETRITYKEIEERFGKPVADGVLALTKNSNISDPRHKIIDSLERIKKQPIEVWVVKLADRLANLSFPPFYWDNKKKRAYLEESEMIYNYLHEASPFLSQKLYNKMIEYQRFIKNTAKNKSLISE